MARTKKSAQRAKALKAFKAVRKPNNTTEEKQDPIGRPVDSFIHFGSASASPYNRLSNFNECSVTGRLWVLTGKDLNEYAVKEYTFPSSEHLWWSHFFVLDRDIKRLAVHGDLASLETGLAHFYEGEELEKKIEYWSRKRNVGIVAKLLAGRDGTSFRKRAKDLGMRMSIHPCDKYGPQGADSTLARIWTRILTAKFTSNRKHRMVLMSTRSHHLVEFSRAPMSRIGKEFWCGRVDHSKVYGGNYMGESLMRIRKSLA